MRKNLMIQPKVPRCKCAFCYNKLKCYWDEETGQLEVEPCKTCTKEAQEHGYNHALGITLVG